MERKLHKIHIIPARFIEKRDDKYLIRCLIGETFEDRLFDHFALEGMKVDLRHTIYVLYDRVNKKFAQGPNFVDGTSFIDFATHYTSVEAARRIAQRLLLKWETTSPLLDKEMKKPIYEVRPVSYELGDVAAERLLCMIELRPLKKSML